jgi:heme A synthase
MKSMPEPHIDRLDEPILSTADGYAPKRTRWPGLIGVAVVLAVVIAGVMVTGHDDANRANGSPDRSAPRDDSGAIAAGGTDEPAAAQRCEGRDRGKARAALNRREPAAPVSVTG